MALPFSISVLIAKPHQANPKTGGFCENTPTDFKGLWTQPHTVVKHWTYQSNQSSSCTQLQLQAHIKAVETLPLCQQHRRQWSHTDTCQLLVETLLSSKGAALGLLPLDLSLEDIFHTGKLLTV